MSFATARVLLLALLGLAAAPARAGEFCYLMVFGSQSVPTHIKYTHSFATFVRATGQGPCADAYTLEVRTISWYPASLEVVAAALLPEPGVNLDLHTTLRVVLAHGERVSLWGPYRVDPDLFNRAWHQASLLESGQVRYKAIDSGFPTDRVTNCIHAVLALDEGYRPHLLSPGFGEPASRFITQRLSPWVLDGGARHDWVAARLGLCAYPLVRRDLPPCTGPVRAAFGSFFGATVP
jgi:hypothetical protein